ncbi:mucin-like protein [Mytilus trossulus]|uniref:mucin-like protein n=1 Tax=Mytilus trossulus TaxID=6551 RepID=UPI003005DBA9
MDNDMLFNSSNSASVKRQRLYHFLLQVNWRSCVSGIIVGSSLSVLLSLSLFLIIAPYLNDKPEAESPLADSLKYGDGINTRFSAWQWGSCSKTCGIGVQEGIRTSICPQNVQCVDNETEILRRHCFNEHCSVDGKWSVWMQEPCSVTCGVGTRLRHRQCSNPHPQYGGQNCAGKSIDHINCTQSSCCPGLTDDTLMNCAGGWIRRDDIGACFCFSKQRLSWNSAQQNATERCSCQWNCASHT